MKHKQDTKAAKANAKKKACDVCLCVCAFVCVCDQYMHSNSCINAYELAQRSHTGASTRFQCMRADMHKSIAHSSRRPPSSPHSARTPQKSGGKMFHKRLKNMNFASIESDDDKRMMKNFGYYSGSSA